MLHRLFSLSVVVCLLGLSAPVQAQTFLAADINNSTGMQGGTAATTLTMGYSFTLAQPYYLTSLGIWDRQGNGLADAHPVGLWTDSGTFITSVTVQAGTASTFVPSIVTGFAAGSGWRFETLTGPLFLNTGTYRLGAFYANGSTDDYQFAIPTGQVEWAPGVTFGGNHASNAGSLSFPGGSNSGFDVGVLGPNMILAVPEPTTWALMGLGAVLAAGGNWQYRRRRTRLLDQNAEPCVTE